jgi:uncharacterized protein (TIGR03435 family)
MAARSSAEGGDPVRGGRYEILGATLVDLIRTAYGVEPDAIIGGRRWLASGSLQLLARHEMRPRPAWARERFAVDQHADRRRFASAVRPEKPVDRAARDAEIEPVDREGAIRRCV